MTNARLTIVIPFYRQPGLVARVLGSLEACLEELTALNCRLILVNDSPDDPDLHVELQHAVGRVGKLLPTELLVNERNVGFIVSVNRAARVAVDRGDDVLLLNSDTEVLPGAVRELLEVSRIDPMVAFVSPRSNNATICTFPHHGFDGPSKASPSEALVFLKAHFPRYQYVPTAVGFCMLIRARVFQDFGYFDEIYGRGYNEENDLILRANRRGYRAVIANHAYVLHVGEVSFAAANLDKREIDHENEQILTSRYPEYFSSVQRYLRSPAYQTERLLTNLVPVNGQVPRTLLFDFSNIGPYHNGTIEAAMALLKSAAGLLSPRYELYVSCSEEVAEFHQLSEISNIEVLPLHIERTFAATLHIGQPFHRPSVPRVAHLAPVTLWFMLDTIAMDCLYLASADLEPLWRHVLRWGDGVIYNSSFTKDQFHRRFVVSSEVRELVSHHSTRLRDYHYPDDAEPEEDVVLLIGNSFQHKGVDAAIEHVLAVLPDAEIVALGLESHPAQNVRCISSGLVSEAEIARLYRRAKFVIYPSHYEGFGFPLLRALGNNKPILVRDIPAIRELVAQFPDHAANVTFFQSDRELHELLVQGVAPWTPPQDLRDQESSEGWARSLVEIEGLLGQLLTGKPSYERLFDRLAEAQLIYRIGEGAVTTVSQGSFIRAMSRLNDRFVGFAGRHPLLRKIGLFLWRISSKIAGMGH